MAYTTIDDPSAHFQTLLYTGNAAANRALTNDGNSDLQPDWLWIHPRNNSGGYFNALQDTSRGVTKILSSNATAAEVSTSAQVLSVQSDGFTVDDNADGQNYVNLNNINYVAWQWKANGGTETNSQAESGSNIACSVQANTTAGFSIITYTGTGGTGHTFLHGLGSAPAWFIIKRRNDTEDWLVYHHKNTSAPETDHLLLNTTDATSDSDTRFDDTAPNGTEIALGNNAVCNADASTYVCYAFKEIKGFSKFGSYTGNADNNGPFVYLGFKPAWLLIKCSIGHTESWHMWDNKRVLLGGNPNQAALSPDTTGADTGSSTPYNVDFLSNGFKIREDHDITNGDGDTYVYMAFAESPFVSSEGIPTTAE
jgi:hypothetical protein